MIPFNNRFHGHKSLNFVYRHGDVVRSRLLNLKYIKNPHRNDSRIAVVISKKIMKSAVRRNRIRRRIYEYIRLKLPELEGVYDLVFIATSGELLSIEYNDLINQVDQLLKQADIK